MSDDARLRLWDSRLGLLATATDAHDDLTALAVCLPLAATAGAEGTVRVYQVATSADSSPANMLRQLHGLDDAASRVLCLALSTTVIVAGCESGAVLGWHLPSRVPLAELPGVHTDEVAAIHVLGPHRAVSAAWDGRLVCVWD